MLLARLARLYRLDSAPGQPGQAGQDGHWTVLLAWLDSAPGQIGQGSWPQAKIDCLLFQLICVIFLIWSTVVAFTTEDQNWSENTKIFRKGNFF